MDPDLTDIHDLTPEVTYTITACKQCRGSCGLYYVTKTKYPNTETLLLVTVRPGNNIYDYLV